MKYLRGLFNPISLFLLVLMLFFFSMAFLYLKNGHPTGFIWIGLGAFLSAGFRQLNPSPREVGLITILGRKSDIKVEGITLVLDQFGINIFGLVVFNMVLVQKQIEIASVRCADGIRLKSGDENGVSGFSLAWIPDEDDLINYDNAGQENGVYETVRGIIIVGTQQIVSRGIPGVVLPNPTPQQIEAGVEKLTWKWFESNPTKVANYLAKMIKANRPPGDEDSSDDTRGLGIIIKKLNTPLIPVKGNVIDADENTQVELSEREAELADTETINKQVAARIQFYKDKGIEKPDPVQCRAEVFRERLAKDGKVQVIDGNGKNVNVTGANR